MEPFSQRPLSPWSHRRQVLTRLQKLTPRVRAVQGGLAQVMKEAKAYLAPLDPQAQGHQ